jgi:hypothetical protein
MPNAVFIQRRVVLPSVDRAVPEAVAAGRFAGTRARRSSAGTLLGVCKLALLLATAVLSFTCYGKQDCVIETHSTPSRVCASCWMGGGSSHQAGEDHNCDTL